MLGVTRAERIRISIIKQAILHFDTIPDSHRQTDGQTDIHYDTTNIMTYIVLAGT